MPLLVYSVADFTAFTIIRSADVNSKFDDIKTLLNTTKIDDDNIQDAGITRADKLAVGTADTIVTNDPTTGKMGETNIVAGGLLSKNTTGALVDTGAGTLGQLLKSNAGDTPTWIDNPVVQESFFVRSGAVRSTSNQPAFLDPAGVAGGATVTVLATSTPLVVEIASAAITVSSDIAVSSLTLAPSSNNTCLVNDVDAAGGEGTRNWGEAFHYVPNSPHKTSIAIDTVGAEIGTRNGKLAAFKNQTSGEYFLARVDTTNGVLKECFRGYYYDSSIAPINRKVLNNNEVLQLMSLGYLYLDADGTTVDVTYNEPTHSFTEPSTPATGDYWHDLGNDLVKRYSGSAFVSVSRVLLGTVVIDTADAIAVRCVDFNAIYKADQSIRLVKESVTQFRASNIFGEVSVAGSNIKFGNSRPTWDIAADLAGSADMYDATEQATRQYYFYVKDDGDTVISDIAPYQRYDLRGFYHPHNPWKMLCQGFNTSGSDLSYPVAWEMDAAGSISSEWSEPELAIITATTTSPTKGTVAVDRVQFRRSKSKMAGRAEYRQTVAGSNGSGAYVLNPPGGYLLDTDVMPALAGGSTANSSPAGSGSFTGGGGFLIGFSNLLPDLNSKSGVGIQGTSSASDQTWSSGSSGNLSVADATFILKFDIKIQNWD